MLEKLDNLDRKIKDFNKKESVPNVTRIRQFHPVKLPSLAKPLQLTDQTQNDIFAAERNVMEKLDILDKKLSAFKCDTISENKNLNAKQYKSNIPKFRRMSSNFEEDYEDVIETRKIILNKLSTFINFKSFEL